MKVNQVSTPTITYIAPNRMKMTAFKSSFRSVYNDNLTLKYNTNTCFFRKDLRWKEFVDYIEKKYQNINKVNIVDYACSTGEEPSSLAMLLDMKLGEKAEKFFPISAYDIEEENIKDAKRGLFKINPGEMELVEENMGDKYKDYFSELINTNGAIEWLSSKSNLDSKIVYTQSDIKKDILKIPRENTIFICKNFFPYLAIGEEKELVKQIANHLGSNSVVVLGNFDISHGIEKLFHKEGFVSTQQYNVLEKLPYFKLLFTKLLYKLKIK